MFRSRNSQPAATATFRVGSSRRRGPSRLWALAEGWEAASTKAVATAPKPALLLQASTSSAGLVDGAAATVDESWPTSS
jgi:hypothetical protein